MGRVSGGPGVPAIYHKRECPGGETVRLPSRGSNPPLDRDFDKVFLQPRALSLSVRARRREYPVVSMSAGS
jgi:hypothetical protein